MSRFMKAVTDLIACASAPEEGAKQVQASAQEVCGAIAVAAPAELDEGLRRMADSIANVDMPGAAIVAICAGVIVENGGNAEIALDATLSRLEETLTLAQFFAEACEEMAADDDDRAPTDGEETGDDNPIDKFGEQVALQMPENARAFHAVEPLGMGAIAMLSRCPAGRRRARPELASLAGDLAPYHLRAQFLEKILSVLDDEVVLVLHPAERKGYRVRLTGIGTNFELFILLADALIGDPDQGWLPGQKPPPSVVAACKDQPAEGAQKQAVEGAFNFYNWQALRPDGTLPEPGDYASSKHWIWMEGIPADIEIFEGQRVILLGPPPYARVLQPGRCFEGMTADLKVAATLTGADVELWLQKLSAAAPRPQLPGD